MTQRIATVTLNPAFDLVGRLTRIEIGEVNTVETLGLYPAGKGINVAKVLADLGTPPTVTGFLGEENQGDFVQNFAQNGLTDHFYRIGGKTRINVKITETEADVTDLNFLGFRVSAQDWQKFIEQSVLDSSNAALTEGLKAHPWLVKPNRRELEVWVGRPLNSREEIIEAAEQLRQHGIENVIISMGEQGSLWLNHEGVLQAKPPRCENVVSTVGAGDSMVAGVIYGLAQSWDKEKTLRFASATSALAVSQSNVGISDRKALETIFAQTEITVISKNI